MKSGSRIPRAFRLLALFCALAPALVSHGTEFKPKMTVAAFGLFGDQSVFESEAKGAAQIVADRLGASPAIVRANTRNREDATSDKVMATLQAAAMAIDVQ
jgi:hypothetical protein